VAVGTVANALRDEVTVVNSDEAILTLKLSFALDFRLDFSDDILILANLGTRGFFLLLFRIFWLLAKQCLMKRVALGFVLLLNDLEFRHELFGGRLCISRNGSRFLFLNWLHFRIGNRLNLRLLCILLLGQSR